MKTIYYNGTILTMNDNQKIVQAICIENGKILATGNDETILAYRQEDSTCIDLHKQVMMPAFIDPHSHFFGLANSLSECDLTEAQSFDDIIEKLQHFIAENHIPKGEWVRGRSYDQNFLKEGTHPTKDVLDKASSEHKIVISHVSSHMGCANTLALQAKHIDANTPNPKGGVVHRYKDSQEPNGFLEENAFIQWMQSGQAPKPEEIMKNVQKAQQIYASYGITTVQDGMVAAPLYDILTHLAQNHQLYLDVIGYMDVVTAQNIVEDPNNHYVNQYQNHFKIGGYKIFLDGSPQGCTAWMSQPYENQKDYKGYPIYTDEQVAHYIDVALQDHQTLLAHANGDMAAEQFISLYEKASQTHENLYHPVLVHAQLTRPDQLERMPALGMIPTFFIAHTYYWGDIHLKNFGKRGESISAAKTALDLGLPFTFHQDSPVVPPDMMKTVWCAVNRITRNGNVIGEDQKIDVYSALKAITIHGAIQYGEEKEKGSIEPGKQANLVLLSDNPLTIDCKKLDQIQVLETICQGKTIYKKTGNLA